MTRHTVVTILSSAMAATAFACGSADLTAEQRDAYRQVLAYRTDPEAVETRSAGYQQAAAEKFERNVRTLQGADLGDEQQAALRTLSTCTLEVTEDAEQTDAGCADALAAVRSAVEQRLD